MEKKPQSNYDSQVDVGRRIFLEYDQERLIHKFLLDADEQWIYLIYMNTPCRISRESYRPPMVESPLNYQLLDAEAGYDTSGYLSTCRC